MSLRRWLAAGVAAALLTSLAPFQAWSAGFAAVMPDAAYRDCVTAKLGLAAGAEPTTAQLDSITELSCAGRGIADATGTSAQTNLTKLFHGGNKLTDVTPQAGSTKVFSLGLQNNQIADISPLRALTALSTVSLEGNRLTDISVLGGLPAWKALSGGTRHGQKAVGSRATAARVAPVPVVVGSSGSTVTPTAPSGAVVSGTTVTYPAPGSYAWSFRDPADFSFNGTVTVEVGAPSVVTVPDDGLRACLNAKIEAGRAADVQPTEGDLAALTGSLTCSNRGITDLTGLDLASGLSGTVNLSNNAISDLTPVSGLTKVTSLNLFQNDITSLRGLGSLPALATLSVHRTATSTKAALASLAGVERLTGLTALTINHQGLTSLAPLAGHRKLTSLTATDNAIADVSPLRDVPLASRLDLQRNRIADLSPLAGKRITTLNVTGQQLTATDAKATVTTGAPTVIQQDGTVLVATPPSGVVAVDSRVTYPTPGTFTWTWEVKPALQAATFGGSITQVVGEAPPVIVDVAIPDAALRACLATALKRTATDPITADDLGGLTSVSCVGKGIVDLTGAEHLTGATEIVLSTNKLTTLEPLAALGSAGRLKKLWAAGNQVPSLQPLAGLTSLTDLNVSNNPFTDLAPLAGLTALTDLDVSQRSGRTGHPGVESLAGLEKLTGLTRLNVNNSRLTDLTGLASLANLTNLAAGGNQIADISALAGLTKLTSINLRDNRIIDVTALRGAVDATSLGLSTTGSPTCLRWRG